jgi:hypothetical protein
MPMLTIALIASTRRLAKQLDWHGIQETTQC